jgi:hypothetical protein
MSDTAAWVATRTGNRWRRTACGTVQVKGAVNHDRSLGQPKDRTLQRPGSELYRYGLGDIDGRKVVDVIAGRV